MYFVSLDYQKCYIIHLTCMNKSVFVTSPSIDFHINWNYLNINGNVECNGKLFICCFWLKLEHDRVSQFILQVLMYAWNEFDCASDVSQNAILQQKRWLITKQKWIDDHCKVPNWKIIGCIFKLLLICYEGSEFT